MWWRAVFGMRDGCICASIVAIAYAVSEGRRTKTKAHRFGVGGGSQSSSTGGRAGERSTLSA